MFQISKLSSNDKFTLLSHVPSKVDLKNYNEESYNDLNIQRKEIKENYISNNMMDSLLSININSEMQPNLNSIIHLIIKTDFLFQ